MARKNTSGRRRSKWLVPGIVLAVLGLPIVGMWFFRVEIAQYATDRWVLPRLGLNKVTMQIRSVGPSGLTIGDVRAENGYWQVNGNHVGATYSLNDLIDHKRLKDVSIKGVRLGFNLDAFMSAPSTFKRQSLDPLLDRGLPAVPLDSASLSDSRVTVSFHGQQRTFSMGATVSGTGSGKSDSPVVAAFLDRGSDNRISLRVANAKTGHDWTVSAAAQVVHPLDWLAYFAPDWRKQFGIPGDLHLAVNPVSVSGDATMNQTRVKVAAVNGQAENLSASLPDAEVRIAKVKGGARFAGEQLDSAHATVDLKGGRWKRLVVGPFQTTVALPKPQSATVDAGPVKIAWNNNDIRSVLQASASLKLDSNFRPVSGNGRLAVNGFSAAGWQLEPFHVDVSGNGDKASVRVPELRATGLRWLALQGTQASVSGYRGSDFKLSLHGNAILIPGQMPGVSLLDKSKPVPDVHLQFDGTGSRDAGGSDQVSVTVKPAGGVLNLQGIKAASVAGKLGLHLTGTGNETTGIWRGKADLTGSDLQGKASGVQFEVSSLQSSLEVEDTPVGFWRKLLASPFDVKMVEALLSRVGGKVAFSGNRIELPGVGKLSWYSGELALAKPPKSEESAGLTFDLTGGILAAGPETLNQVEITGALKPEGNAIHLEAKLTGSLEGGPLVVHLDQVIRMEHGVWAGSGHYAIDPVSLQNSDIVSRWVPSLAGISFSGRFSVAGDVHWNASGKWDASARIDLNASKILYPNKRLEIDGLSTIVAVDSIRNLRTAPSQAIQAREMKVGDITLTNVRASGQVDGLNRIALDTAQCEVFGGRLWLDPFTVSLPKADASFRVHAKDVRIASVVSMMPFFRGTMDGRVSGLVPITLKDGHITPGSGYLELDEGYPSHLSYAMDGILGSESGGKGFSTNIKNYVTGEVEKGFKDMNVKRMRIDLFNPQYPGTPIKIVFSGMAHAPAGTLPLLLGIKTRVAPVKVPIDDFQVNVNGSVAEVLSFILRLKSM